MRNPRRSLPATVLAAAVALGAAACGSSPSDPLAGLTSKQIAAKAMSGTEAAPAVRVTGSGASSGQSVTLDLTLVRGKGCEGTVGEGSQGSLRLIGIGSTLWILPDSRFYQTSGAPATVAPLLEGKYLALKNSTSGFASFSPLCTMSKLLGPFALGAGDAKGVRTSLDGQTAIEIVDTTGKGHAYVSDSATPELLRVQMPGSSGGTLNFSYPSPPVSITPPPASEVVDGSQYGF